MCQGGLGQPVFLFQAKAGVRISHLQGLVLKEVSGGFLVGGLMVSYNLHPPFGSDITSQSTQHIFWQGLKPPTSFTIFYPKILKLRDLLS